MNRASRALLCVVALGTAACATIVGKREQLVGIRSQPDQATVTIVDEDGTEVFRGLTPTTVTLAKGDGYFQGKDYTVAIAKDGYQPQAVELKTSPNAWYIGGNLLFGGLIGWLIVDPLTGAMWTLRPGEVDTSLSTSTAFDSGAGRLTVVLLEDVPAGWRDRLVPLR